MDEAWTMNEAENVLHPDSCQAKANIIHVTYALAFTPGYFQTQPPSP